MSIGHFDGLMDKGTSVMNDGSYVIAVGASAGGLKAIQTLISELPANLNAPIVIAVHSVPASKLAEILQYGSSLPIKTVEDGEKLESGQIYVAPGATHVFFQNGCLKLSDVVTDSGYRPSIDALFMTLAAEYGARSIAVVLSGTLKDGMRGAQIIYDVGGRTIVQDPDDAKFEDMPKSVIRNDHPEKISTAAELGAWIGRTAGRSV